MLQGNYLKSTKETGKPPKPNHSIIRTLSNRQTKKQAD